MRKTTVVFIAILTIILMSCGNKANNDSKKTTLVDKESGAKISATANQQKLPNDFPTDIFIIKGTIENISTVEMGNQKTVTIFLSKELSPKETRAEIVKNMEANDWTTEMNVASQLYFSKENKTLKIGIVEDDNKTKISYFATY